MHALPTERRHDIRKPFIFLVARLSICKRTGGLVHAVDPAAVADMYVRAADLDKVHHGHCFFVSVGEVVFSTKIVV